MIFYTKSVIFMFMFMFVFDFYFSGDLVAEIRKEINSKKKIDFLTDLMAAKVKCKKTIQYKERGKDKMVTARPFWFL